MTVSTATGAGSCAAADGGTIAAVAPCREQIAQFVEIIFVDAPAGSYVSLRSFYDDLADSPPFQSTSIKLTQVGDREHLIDTAFAMARAAAACPRSIVLCPPLATFAKPRSAKAVDLVAGLCLSVECDARAADAKRTLSAVLGNPTLTVASGGIWTNPETGEIEDKLHLHWVLQEPAITPEDHRALYRARAYACDLVGADATSKSPVHPLRWPGSVHRKMQPRLCRIIEATGTRIDLHEALTELEGLVALRQSLDSNGSGIREAGSGGSGNDVLSGEILAGCADRIPNDDVDWAEWNRLGMAFWRGSGGDADGYAAFAKWSGKSPKYDAEATRARWNHYSTSPPDRIGAGTLVHLAREVDPSFLRRQREQPRDDEATAPAWNVETGAAFEPFRRAVAEVNERFFIVQMGGSVVIGSYQRDHTLDRETLYFVKPADFRLKFGSRHYLVGYTQRGLESWKPLGEAWLASSLRRQYDQAAMLCRGDCPADVLNLWRGWGAAPREGDWETVAWHLLYIVCGGNEDHYLYLIRLLARWVQQAEERGEVAIVLRGDKGVGKGSVADILKRWFRHHYVHIAQTKHLTGHFNAHLADCLFLFADEVVWGGEKQGEGVLKALVTERVVQIEPKGVNTFQMPNRLKILIASNNDWVVPVTAEERRYFVLDVTSDRLNDRAYFNRLHAAIDAGEAEAMLHDLLQMDLSDFDHRAVPHTDGLNRQKLEGLDSVGAWWASCLDEGRICGIPHLSASPNARRWPTEIEKAQLHGAYVAHAHAHGERHPKAQHVFPQAWRKFTPSVRETKPHGQPRRWLLQSLNHHRAEFLKEMRIDAWPWPEADEAELEAENVTRMRTRS